MKITLSPKSLEEISSDYVRVHITEDDKGMTRMVLDSAQPKAARVLEIGAGKFSEMNQRKFITLCRMIVQTAKRNKIKKFAIEFRKTPALFQHMTQVTGEEAMSLMVQNFEMANFEFNTFKTKPKEGWNAVGDIIVCGPVSKSLTDAAKKGQLIGQEVNACRELANTPGGSMMPRQLAAAAKNAVKGIGAGKSGSAGVANAVSAGAQTNGVTVKTLGRKELTELGMGLLAGVGAGSTNEPTFTILEYKGSSDAPIVIAGKGITFDSGGLNIKPSAHIYEMHMDMSGGAAVIHAVALAAKLKLKKHVIGLIAASENMPGNNATRPGDILTSLSGKTVEVTDTDAEGRLVLADAITYAKRFKPSVLIDVATLTGAAMSAVGLHASALLTRDETLSTQLRELGEQSGDYLWPLPMWDEYEEVIKSDFADLCNYPIGGSGRYGGATGGAMFLWQFAKELDCPWAHIDMAPRMTSVPGDELAKGAAGEPVRLLLAFIESWKN